MLPFAQGDYTGQPLSVEGEYAHAEPFGARWPDGTWRYVRLTFPASAQAQERKLVEVRDAPVAAPGFGLSSAIRNTTGILFGVIVGDKAESPGAEFGGWRCIEANPLTKVFQSTVRVPGTPVWAELMLEFRSGFDHARWWLTVGAADMTRSEQSYRLPEIWFVARGPAVKMWHAPFKSARAEAEPGSVERAQDRQRRQVG